MGEEEVGIIELDRPVDVLANMSTYQGMTDAEIDRLLQWKIDMALGDALGEAQSEIASLRAELTLARCASTCENAQSVLESTLRATVPFVSIVDENSFDTIGGDSK